MFHIKEEMKKYWDIKNRPKATTREIDEIEAKLSIKLPIAYVEFITQYGFVLFDDENDTFDYTISFPDRQEIHEGDIGFLHNSEKLLMVYENLTKSESDDDPYAPAFPLSYFPVGNDAGQGQILLKMEGERVGSVWYWPENEWAWGTEDNTWLGFVAEDFYEFINKLRPYE